MKEIFTDLYKKVAGFFQATEGKKDESKNVACNRLKFVLMQDRTNLNPYLLERMRSEMIDVLSKYVEMDKEALELSFEQEGESMALMLSIPVIRAKDEEEIQALIKEEEEVKAAKAAAKAEAEEETSEEVETEEEIQEGEEAFEDDAAKTVDAESEEEVQLEELCTCEEDEEGELVCDETCGCESEDCESENKEEVEENFFKKAKKNKK